MLEGGRAVADVLFGDYNPNGKLPFTYPRSPGYLTTYDANLFERVMDARKLPSFQPQFEFGHGLSYTTFEYLDLRATPNGANVNVSVNVRNTGTKAGKETVIVYVRDEFATLTPAAKRVRRFAKVSLAAGESKALQFTLRRADLSYVGLENKPVFEPGEFTVIVGNQSAKFTLQ